jgi:hypothetical protein
LSFWRLEEPIESIELLLDSFLLEEEFADEELYGSPPLCSEDDNDEEDSSTSGAELLLSSPQAARNAEPHKTAVATVNFPKNFILLS